MTAPFHPGHTALGPPSVLPPGRGTRAPSGPQGPLGTGDPDDMAAMLCEVLLDNAKLTKANVAHRRTLGYLLGHPDPVVVTATEEALARYGAERPEAPPSEPAAVQPRTRAVLAAALHAVWRRGGA